MHFLKWTVIAIVMLFPVVAFVVPKGVGGSFYLLLLCSLIGIVLRLKPMGKSFIQLLKEYRFVSLAMSGILLATLINQLARGCILLNPLERPFYLASFPLLFWVLLIIPEKILRQIPWALALGASVCVIALHINSIGGERPSLILGIPLIPFIDMAVLSGMLALFSLGWDSMRTKFGVVLKCAAGIVALYGSYLSQTRGNWISLPLFIALAVMIFPVRPKKRYFLAAVVLLCAFCLNSHIIESRINSSESDIEQFWGGGNRDTSLGLRIQNWQGAWQLFKEHPIFGVGVDQYRPAIEQLQKRQLMSAAAVGQAHSHNDILFQMATSGFFGLTAILALYFVPAGLFFGELRSSDQETRAIAGMGLALTLGFFIYGLSDAMFFWRISYAYYIIQLAFLFACLEKRKLKLNCQQTPSKISKKPFNASDRRFQHPV